MEGKQQESKRCAMEKCLIRVDLLPLICSLHRIVVEDKIVQRIQMEIFAYVELQHTTFGEVVLISLNYCLI